MALITGEDYEDLVSWVRVIVSDTAKEYGLAPHEVHGLAVDIAVGFEQLLINHYGED